jgi:phosphoenolpyruvate synthase/pyruvate phosphate dikinase
MIETGERLETVRITNAPDYLREVMTRAGEAPEVVLEACYGWYWAADTLAELTTPADHTAIRGSRGSPGKASGPAQVLQSLADARRLQPRGVLVVDTTAPPWTPLFATAAAVVSDTGGILSHCAVIAREYGIPAVVGTGNATSRITDGQQIEVDGDAGIVRLLP